jgi:hypothetical protein
VECGLGRGDAVVGGAVEGGVVAFAEVVGLDLGGVCAGEFLQEAFVSRCFAGITDCCRENVPSRPRRDRRRAEPCC